MGSAGSRKLSPEPMPSVASSAFLLMPMPRLPRMSVSQPHSAAAPVSSRPAECGEEGWRR